MKTALLLLYVSVFRRPLQQKIVLFENTSLLWAENIFGKKKNSENAAIKSHKRASQTGNCGSVLVCNVNKGTLELKKETLEIISPSNTASCLLQWLHGEFCGC